MMVDLVYPHYTLAFVSTYFAIFTGAACMLALFSSEIRRLTDYSSVTGLLQPEIIRLLLTHHGNAGRCYYLIGKHVPSSAYCLRCCYDSPCRRATAYVVCSDFGLDTGARSFPYVALCSKDKAVLKGVLSTIQQVSAKMIDVVEANIKPEEIRQSL